MYSEKINLKLLGFPPRAAAWGDEDIENNVLFRHKASDLKWLSLAFDESIDVTDTARLFIWGVNAKSEVTGELTPMNILCRTHMGEIFSKKLRKHTNLVQLNWQGFSTTEVKQNLLWCATNDNGQTIYSEEEGTTEQINIACEIFSLCRLWSFLFITK